MEEVTRQFGQHIAVEPEWEAGFSLQIQLRHILAMFQDWCSSDVSCQPAFSSNNGIWCVGWTIKKLLLSVHLKIAEEKKSAINFCCQLLLACSSLRMRSCCLHLKSATKSWCSAIISPFRDRLLTTTCASTSSMFVRTKCPSSLSAYIFPLPGYLQVGELILEALSDVLVFFVCCELTT